MVTGCFSSIFCTERLSWKFKFNTFSLKTEVCELSDLTKVYRFTLEFKTGKYSGLTVCCIGDSFQLWAIKMQSFAFAESRHIPIHKFVSLHLSNSLPVLTPLFHRENILESLTLGFWTKREYLEFRTHCACATLKSLCPIIYICTRAGQGFQKGGKAFTRPFWVLI